MKIVQWTIAFYYQVKYLSMGCAAPISKDYNTGIQNIGTEQLKGDTKEVIKRRQKKQKALNPKWTQLLARR